MATAGAIRTVETADASRTVEAVLFDLDDVLVPFHTVRAFQWAWKPQGPVLGERRTHSALRRSLHAWDRRRWAGVTGKAPAADLVALREHLGATLADVAGHAVPPEETEAVVRRLLRPAGDVERYPDVAPALDRLRRAGVKVGVLTPLPADSARWLLHRTGIAEELVVGSGDGPDLPVPARAAFRSAAEHLGASASRTAFVGDLFWSDARAAVRAGLVAILLDRDASGSDVDKGRITTLGGLEAALAAASSGGTSPAASDGSAGAPPAGDLL